MPELLCQINQICQSHIRTAFFVSYIGIGFRKTKTKIIRIKTDSLIYCLYSIPITFVIIERLLEIIDIHPGGVLQGKQRFHAEVLFLILLHDFVLSRL